MKNSTTFASIFSDIKHRGKKLNIGKYQRPISWGRTETYHFINDARLAQNDDDNNYGAAYLFERNKRLTDIVEGQQRFITFMTTLSGIKNFIADKHLDDNEELNSIKKDIKEILCTQSGFPLIETTGQDNIDIEAIINNNIEYIKLNKSRKLINNYNVILTYIREIYKAEGIYGIKSFYYDGMNKASVVLDYCQTEEEVVKMFERLNRATKSPTAGNTINSNLYSVIKKDKNYSDEEKNNLINRLEPIRFDPDIDIFYANYIYFKTGNRYPLTNKIVVAFNNIVKEQTSIKDFVNEIVNIYNFHKSVSMCDIHCGRYSEYENKKLNSTLKVFCNPLICEDIVPIITDLLFLPKEVIPIDDVIDIVMMLFFTHLRASIIGYSSHTIDGFIIKGSFIRKLINNKTDSISYQDLLYSYLVEINNSYLKQYSDTELINKINNDFNLYYNKFRDSILNIINNYDNKGELQDLFDDCNTIQREHIKCQNEFAKSDYVQNLAGNITVIVAKDNLSNGDKPFAEKINSFINSNFNLNKVISEHTIWEEKEIREETSRRAKIIADFTNPARFCNKLNVSDASYAIAEATYV